jgi:hypothetical protein
LNCHDNKPNTSISEKNVGSILARVSGAFPHSLDTFDILEKEMTTYSVQVEIPGAKYELGWFLPMEMSIWFHNRGFKATLSHTHSSGTGYTNGVSNTWAAYLVTGLQNKNDALMFKLRFPHCKVITFENNNENFT